MAEEAPKKTRFYCNHCKVETNHQLIGEHSIKSYDDEADFGEIATDRMWICMGCEHGVLQQEYSNSEMMDPKAANTQTWSIFPNVLSMTLRPSHIQN